MSLENEETGTTISIPSTQTLQHAVKISLAEDRPILLDYFNASNNDSCFIGVRENDEKLLVKNEDEYTSPISKIYSVGEEYIITTENSLYIVYSKISNKRIE